MLPLIIGALAGLGYIGIVAAERRGYRGPQIRYPAGILPLFKPAERYTPTQGYAQIAQQDDGGYTRPCPDCVPGSGVVDVSPPPKPVGTVYQAPSNPATPTPPPVITMPTPSSDRVDWSRVRYFKKSEFRGYADQLDPRVIYAADEVRHRLRKSVVISQLDRGMVRHDCKPPDMGGSSYHCTAGGTVKGRALDLQCHSAKLREIFDICRAVPGIGGVGLYPDHNNRGSFHIDVGPSRTPWMFKGRGRNEKMQPIDWNYITSRGR